MKKEIVTVALVSILSSCLTTGLVCVMAKPLKSERCITVVDSKKASAATKRKIDPLAKLLSGGGSNTTDATGVHYLILYNWSTKSAPDGITPRLNASQSYMTDDYMIGKR